MNIKNKTLAILAAPAAIPPKPNIPATMARIIKMTVQRSIILIFLINTDFVCYIKFPFLTGITLTLNIIFLSQSNSHS